jgi:hypothetical protein
LLKLIPKRPNSFFDKLVKARDSLPLPPFEKKVYECLESLQNGLPSPDLQQIVDGRIEGVSGEESQKILSKFAAM